MKKLGINVLTLFLIIVMSAWAGQIAKVPVVVSKAKGNAGECFKIVESEVTITENDYNPQATITVEIVKPLTNIKNPELRGIDVSVLWKNEANQNVLAIMTYFGNDAEYEKINQALKEGATNQKFKLNFAVAIGEWYGIDNFKSIQKVFLSRADVVEATDAGEFSAFFRDFQKVSKSGDINAYADMMEFPFGLANNKAKELFGETAVYPNTKQGFFDGGYDMILPFNPKTKKIKYEEPAKAFDNINPDILDSEQKLLTDKRGSYVGKVERYKVGTEADYVITVTNHIKGRKKEYGSPYERFYFKKIGDKYKFIHTYSTE